MYTTNPETTSPPSNCSQTSTQILKSQHMKLKPSKTKSKKIFTTVKSHHSKSQNHPKTPKMIQNTQDSSPKCPSFHPAALKLLRILWHHGQDSAQPSVELIHQVHLNHQIEVWLKVSGKEASLKQLMWQPALLFLVLSAVIWVGWWDCGMLCLADGLSGHDRWCLPVFRVRNFRDVHCRWCLLGLGLNKGHGGKWIYRLETPCEVNRFLGVSCFDVFVVGNSHQEDRK